MRKWVKNIKEISKTEIQKLLKAGLIKPTHDGYAKPNGQHIGYVKSVHKRWIEDFFCDKAKEL